MSFRQREREKEVLNQIAKERFTTDVIRKRPLGTSIDTYVDFHAANAVKHGMDSFSVRSDFGSSRFPKETGVDRARRHCSVETIRGAGPSELG